MEPEFAATEAQGKLYRAVEGRLMFLGCGVLPQASLATCKMQQILGSLKVRENSEANQITVYILKLEPKLVFVTHRQSPTLDSLVSVMNHMAVERKYMDKQGSFVVC